DNEQVSSTAFDVNTNADADVKFGTETNKNYGSDPYVFTKRRDARPNETSKAYYRFDLSGITEPILRAKFQVYKPNKYSKGYLTIYALKEGNEAWAENTITWNNAPGNLIASPSYMDMTKVDSLGRWEIKNAQVPQIESYETEAFSQYIENARLNGDKSVTLVITSYSPTEQDKAALQASSKEDTTAPIKPRIQIEYAPKASVLTEILFYPNALTLSVGESKKLQAIAVDQYGAQLPTTVSWSVDNEGDLSDTGLFTATKNGIFTVTASSGNVSKQMTITVNSIVNSFAKPIVEDIPTLIVQHKNMQVFWDNHANFNISIFNLVGQLQLNKVANSECFTEQLTLSNGVYLVHLSKGNHKIASKIIVK
ncbi:DNRLRE domain-containing protein, partial [bacterium]|nr:DNRLRE domain-containing protein [bacterium]